MTSTMYCEDCNQIHVFKDDIVICPKTNNIYMIMPASIEQLTAMGKHVGIISNIQTHDA